MGIWPEDLIHGLRVLRPFKSKPIEGRSFGVCASPSPRGKLTEQEYAPYLAAADGKHDSYMRHGAPWADGDLAYEVTVKDTVVAWLPYDGVPRVIEHDFGDPDMNRARDLAREHLGADPKAQQELAEERGDIRRLSAEGFARVIGQHLHRAEHGSQFTDFPLDISVSEWSRRRLAEARAKAEEETRGKTLSGYEAQCVAWPHVPNPTVEYTDQQRREWAAQAARYLAAYRERFPREYTIWTTHQHHAAHREGKKLPPLQVGPGDRIGIMSLREMKPAILLKVEEFGKDLHASIRTEDGEFDRVWIYPQKVTPGPELLPETRDLWQPVWDRLAAAPDSSACE